MGNRVLRCLRSWGLLPLVIAFVASLGLSGCSTKTTSVQQTPIISLTITQAPASTLPLGGTTTTSATVANDVANAGVDWVAICSSLLPTPNCGSFSPAHTASGAATTFTAPPDIPKGNMVYVSALSSTDHSKSYSAPISLTSSISGVTITQPPPANYPSGASLVMAAVVAGDPANFLPGQAGVDWKATCGTVDCTSGFVAGTHSDPGNTITFTVPTSSVALPNIIGSTVTITAISTVDYHFQATAMFVVTGGLSVAFTPVPPSTLLTTQTTPIVATTSNDLTNAGIDLQISCPNTPCGSWSATDPTQFSIHTASGVAQTFYPPTITAPLQVTITANAAAGGASALAMITVIVPISVQIDTTQIPNSELAVGKSGAITATVSNDSANAGVDWTSTCGSPGACGSFSPAHTASGSPTTFTAPATVPSGGTVTITATSTADSTKNSTATLTITAGLPPNALLLGQFVISLTGRDANGGAYALGGVIVGDGKGNLTGASLEIAEGLGQAAGSTIPLSQTTPSTYSIGTDGRGQIQLVLNTNAPAFGNINSYGVSGTGLLTLSVTFVSTNHALLSETDTFGSGTGTLDLQNIDDLAAFSNGTAGLNGTYSLMLSGAQSLSPSARFFLSGALTFQFAGGTLTETAAVADQSNNGVITNSVTPPTLPVNYGAGAPDNNGEIALSNTDLGLPTTFNLNAWIIDKNHFLITDWQDSFSGLTATFIGYLAAQPASPTISGTYAFAEAGATTSLGSQAAGGIFTCGSTGTLDVIPLNGTPLTNQTINAACTAPASGRGLITLSGAGSTASGISQFAAYPTLDMGLDLIELDGGSASPAVGPSGAGVALPQTLATPISASSFSGKYASNFLANTPMGMENFAAQIVSDGVSKLSGTADVNSFNTTATPPVGTPSSNATLSGTFSASNNGRFQLAPLTITPAVGQPAPEISTLNPACYIVDASTCLLLGLDKTAPGTGILQMQQNFGFATGLTGVSITQAPPPSLPAGAGSPPLAATAVGDTTNGGVDWTAVCGTTPTPCGSFNPAHTNPGATTIFTAPTPAQVPGIVGGTVTITAAAHSDHSFTATASVMVTAPISIALNQAPPNTLVTSATATLAATLTNDTTNSGVDWTCLPAGTCGTFSQAHTTSGATTIFTAPVIAPAPNGVVTITASSTADPTMLQSAAVAILNPISVQITQGVPNNTLPTNAPATLVATVSNDPANLGVDWTCTPTGACGSFVPAHTDDAGTISTIYTAPASVPAGGMVTITATSTTDKTKSVAQAITITKGVIPNSLLNGQFVILMTAKNSANGPYVFGGVITGDGKGNITGGRVDVTDASGNANSAALVQILPAPQSTYSIGQDGRGTITLMIDTSNLNGTFGVNGSGLVTLSVVFATPVHAVLSETDTFGSGTGTLDKQNQTDLTAFANGTTGLNGTYSLILSGVEQASPHPDYFVAGAVKTQFAGGTVTQSGAIADQSDNGVITSAPFQALSNAFAGTPDSSTGEWQTGVMLGLPTSTFSLDVWLIDATHFVVTDYQDAISGTPGVIVGGYLVAQPAAPAISGAYAFTETGDTPSPLNPQVAGGIFTCGSTGTLDVAPLNGTVLSSQSINAACTAPANGRGLITLSGAGSTASGIKQFAAYPTIDTGLNLIELDGGSASPAVGPSGAGVAMQQTLAPPIAPTSFSGKYAAHFLVTTSITPPNLASLENFAAQIVSDGVSTVTGTADVNSFDASATPPAATPSVGAALSGSLTANPNGRFPLSITFTPASGQPMPHIATLNPACYIVDVNTCLLLGLDTTAPGTGILQMQQNLGF